jgi:hypothetical protein
MRAWVAAVVAISLLGAAPARAQSATSDPQAAARARGEEGLRLFEASRWAEAFEAFQSADAIFHAPTLVLYMAKCRRNEGKLLEARRLYERITGERLDKAAPDRFKKAQATAKDELEALRKRIPRLAARITGAPGAAGGERATLDGAAVSAAALRDGQEVDPGRHVLTAEADGARPARLEVDVKEGDAAQVELGLVSAAGSAPVVVARAERGSWLPAGIAFGAGGAGLLLGVVSGAIAAAKIADVKSRCVAGDCLVSDIPERDHAKTLVAVSTAGFVVGGAGLVAGTVLTVLRARRAEKAEGDPVGLSVGPGSVAVWGRF